MQRKRILKELDVIRENHCESCDNNIWDSLEPCEGCPYFIQQNQLGEQLLAISHERKTILKPTIVNQILQKGENLTWNDVDFLKANEVSYKEMAVAMKMTAKRFTELRKERKEFLACQNQPQNRFPA